jgi:hypothetical protein
MGWLVRIQANRALAVAKRIQIANSQTSHFVESFGDCQGVEDQRVPSMRFVCSKSTVFGWAHLLGCTVQPGGPVSNSNPDPYEGPLLMQP